MSTKMLYWMLINHTNRLAGTRALKNRQFVKNLKVTTKKV
jgi:hypothetical protein